MLGFLGFILLFILVVVLIGLLLIGNVLRYIFSFGRRTPKRYNGPTQSQADQTQTSASSSAPQKKKIFDDDEGEYVEFEEVK